jgi:hypothetical protein
MYLKKEIIISFFIITISASNLYMSMIWLYVIMQDFLIPFLCDPDLQCVQAELPSTRHVGLPSIKDWIIGSSAFLRQVRGVIITTLLEHDAHLTHISAQELQNMTEIGIPEGFERCIQITDPREGITELYVLNVIITRLQSLAGRLLRQDRDRTNQVVTHINHSLTQLHQQLQDATLTDTDKQAINIRITELKVHLKDKMTQMATQEDARIDAFISKDRDG